MKTTESNDRVVLATRTGERVKTTKSPGAPTPQVPGGLAPKLQGCCPLGFGGCRAPVACRTGERIALPCVLLLFLRNRRLSRQRFKFAPLPMPESLSVQGTDCPLDNIVVGAGVLLLLKLEIRAGWVSLI